MMPVKGMPSCRGGDTEVSRWRQWVGSAAKWVRSATRASLNAADENLNQTISQVESALATLRQVGADEDDDTEGQGYRWSDENLKQEIKSAAGALESLKAIRTYTWS
jgi:hypothetical protein